MGLSLTLYTSAVLHNGLGRYRDALDAAEQAIAYPQELGFAKLGISSRRELQAALPDRAGLARPA